jgi:hypothetical protein
VLRAAEAWPRDKYGLDAPKCWPRLWLLLPDRARQDLTAARAALDAGAAAWLWGVLFVVWTPWAWWAVPVAVAAAVGSYLWMLSAAGAYADLIESAFDVHRSALYEACRWPMPVDAEDERVKGEALTSYLWRGAAGPTPLEPAGRETPADAPTS